jgi:hypothetical protein
LLAVYHYAWLDTHPHRNETWLRKRLADGFDVHHLDGDDENDLPDNLVLIEATDHTKAIHRFPEGYNRVAAHAAVMERKAKIARVFEAACIVHGSYTKKVINGKTYWYFQDSETRRQSYIGPEFPMLLSFITQYNDAKSELMKTI